jgi:hypothetical protein
MGDVRREMTGSEKTRPRRPFYARGPALAGIALVVAAAVLALVLLPGGGGAGTHRAEAGPPGEIDLTQLSSAQLRPVAERVDRESVRVHPQLVRVAGVGTGEFLAPDGKASSSSSSTSSASAPSDDEVRRELAAFRRVLRSAPGVPVGAAASVEPNGTAVAPVDAPNVVAAVIQAGNAIASTPYKWGGGHGAWADTGYDCSGSVSFALAGTGLLASPLDSTGFEKWGAPGPGRWITVYANAGHTFMIINGKRYDTTGRWDTGSRWQRVDRSSAGYVARHPAGL